MGKGLGERLFPPKNLPCPRCSDRSSAECVPRVMWPKAVRARHMNTTALLSPIPYYTIV